MNAIIILPPCNTLILSQRQHLVKLVCGIKRFGMHRMYNVPLNMTLHDIMQHNRTSHCIREYNIHRSRNIPLRYTIKHPTTSHNIIEHPITLRTMKSHDVTQQNRTSRYITQYNEISNYITLHNTTSHNITQYPMTSHNTIEHPATLNNITCLDVTQHDRTSRFGILCDIP